MHKTMKRIASGFLASVVTLSTAAALVPMNAFAGELLGQNDFDAGVGLPWHTCETNPAKQTFNISGGTYNVHIVDNDGPESRWDLQLRHRGLEIKEGKTYKVHWEVTASTAGQMYTKIGNYGGTVEVWHNNSTGASDFGQTWNCVEIQKGKNSFDAEFTADKSVAVAEWAFHYGGKGEHQPEDCFPNGTDLKFDNLYLEEVGTDREWPKDNEMGVVRPESNVRVNQLGYYPNIKKKASYCTDASSPLQFEIRDKSGKAVYTGTTKVFGADPDSGTGANTTVKVGDETVPRYKDSGKYVHIIDFSGFKTEGTYTIFVKDTVGVSGTRVLLAEGVNDTKRSGDKLMWENPQTGKQYVMNQSHPFEITKNVYSTQLLKDSMNYYYQNRSGVPIKSEYVTSGDKSELAHDKYGHNPDKAYIQSKWVKSYKSDASDVEKTKTLDGTGGWYDAGDHGKYVVNGGISVWTLQNAYEFTKKNGHTTKWTDKTIAIPENSNSAPDILDEARVELEWMFKMIDEDGFVYHKLHDHKWTGLATKSWDYDKEKMENGEKGWGTVRIVKPATYAATFNMIACAAQAARLWKGIDDSFANECLSNAKKSWTAIMAKESQWNIKCGNSETDPYFAPLDQAIGGGAYGDTYVGDDAYWAACELFATTKDSTYYNFLKKYKNPNDGSGDDKAFSLTTSLGGGENNGSFSSFNWGCTSGLGTISLYLSNNTPSSDKAAIVKSIKAAGDKYLEQMSKEGMGVPYKETIFEDAINIGKGIKIKGYEWGSNSFVINNAMVLAYAYDADKKNGAKYMNGAAEALDYIYGRNGLGFSYVSGYGDKTMEWPHHRFWSQGVDPTFPKAPNGVLSGGPGAGMQDPYIGGLGFKRGALANQKCYVDSAESWSVNEVTINWNAPLVWMTTFMLDEATAAGDITGDNGGGQETNLYPVVQTQVKDHKIGFKW
ncbi:glycoside hydrolase family 9 protein, partial [uncultured Ruminococcus sp.]|uniref:glycoside hydrolase family 9 protein n=1 Tax=uncultured Ruminococcus sp. TaxID=165186 RepID=UPI0025FC3DB1